MLTDLLESAWASIEGQIAAMTEEEQNELVDEAAGVITQNLRRAVDRFRQLPLQLSDAVRAKAFQIVAADLQAAFGLGSDAPSLSAPLLTPQEAHKGEAYAGLPDGGLNQSILDLLTNEDFENLARINLANGDLYTGVPDAFLIQQSEGTMIGLAEMLDQYLKACDRSGLNPASAMPPFAELSTDYLRTAARIGLK
ncbi:hypothetical protein HYN69_10240 [Gemmobacter aquarius]|uniref:Uncharacterized protein n=1 Tax=Paragemmobacter aquarius TaxID=2169400 RepID=A0A2S0UM04_9RHOB|nr:hypothetical protein [Gemmobacter aquarius]AWB48835.1 hypothetical protein HYN69_10240 [Gemmobacter aquarius]